MRRIAVITSILVGVILIGFGSGAFFIVSEINQVVITQFGKPIGSPITNAGMHFRVPLIQEVHYFDKRILEWDGDPNQIPTKDKKYIWVDAIARWKISDALKFLQSVGDERGAQARLDDIINSASRDAVTSSYLVEVARNSNRVLEEKPVDEEESMSTIFDESALDPIKTGREVIEGSILDKASKLAPQYGIELVDVRIKHVDYIEDVRKKVYERMIAERMRAAEEYRSEGRGKSAEIKGKMEKELQLITSEAYKDAQSIRGKADAEATNIYAEAYNNDPEFYSFLKTLETYRDTIDEKTTVVFTTESDYFKYLENPDK